MPCRLPRCLPAYVVQYANSFRFVYQLLIRSGELIEFSSVCIGLVCASVRTLCEKRAVRGRCVVAHFIFRRGRGVQSGHSHVLSDPCREKQTQGGTRSLWGVLNNTSALST